MRVSLLPLIPYFLLQSICSVFLSLLSLIPCFLLQSINPHLFGSHGQSLGSQQMVDVVEPLEFEEYMSAQQVVIVGVNDDGPVSCC